LIISAKSISEATIVPNMPILVSMLLVEVGGIEPPSKDLSHYINEFYIDKKLLIQAAITANTIVVSQRFSIQSMQ
jgi:hypothetical protein